MSFTIPLIQQALINSLSMNREDRDNSARFLTKECEPNPAFQLALIHIIEQPEGNMQLQYQAILCMKNSLTRLLSQHRSRQRRVVNSGPAPVGVKQVGFTGFAQPKQQSSQSDLSEEMRSQIKEHLLLLVEDSNNVILTENSYEQLTLVVAIFIKYDFPGSWPQFGQWLLKAFDQLHTTLPNLQLQEAPKIKRFLTFCYEVMAEQNRKKLNSSKAQFQKVAKDYLKAVAKVWQFFQQLEEQMIIQNDQLSLQSFNETIFDIASKLDKVLILVVSCGFNLTSLPNDPESNVYVETTARLIKKFKFFVNVVQLIKSQLPESEQKTKYYNIMVGQVKTFLKHLSELQGNDPLLMFNNLDQYLQIICSVLGSSDIYPIRVNKLAMIALFKVINTSIYNQSSQQDLEPQSNGIDILCSPVKFKNLQPMIEHANVLYMKILNMPNQENPDHQDGARKLLELITHKFLSQVDLDSWQSDPEYFIENEDEQFLLEYDLQADCSLNLLAQHLIEKLLQKFYSICYPFVKDIMQQYFTGVLQPMLTERVEDALLNLVGIVGKVQREYKVASEKRLDVCYVLKFIRQCKWDNPIFKRRYLLIITHWAKILPKIYFFEIFQSVLLSLDEISPSEAKLPLNQVFIYEHCHCIHELLKEINYWLQRQDELKKGSIQKELSKDIGELRGPEKQVSDSKEDQIAMSKLIDSQINYSSVFQKLCFKIVPLLDCFKQPTLIWHMICFLTFILEKNCEQPESTIECLRSLNILKILQAQTQSHVDEAVIDMLKNLLCQCPSSPVILEMCTILLDYKLSRSMNDGNAIQFWLFTMRATSQENPNIQLLQNLFIKFSGCLIHVQNSEALPTVNSVANTIIKRDYIYIEFLKVAQEAVLLGMFQSQNGVQQMIQFTTYKFLQSVENEQNTKNRGNNQSSDSQDSDGESNPDMTMFEKQTYLVMIPHTLFWMVQASQIDSDFTFDCQRAMIANCCLYMIEQKIESKAVKQIPSSSLFYTQLLTYLNRMIVVKTQKFMVILQELMTARGLQLHTFVLEWIKKMDTILSQEANRINCLAIYNLLPYFPAQLVKLVLPEVARITFGMLQDYLYQKLINNGSRFHSPSRTSQIGSLMINTNVVRMRTFEKMSQRFEELKRNDLLLDIDLIEHFWQQMRTLATNLQLQDMSILAQFMNDPVLSQQFVNLINGVSLKYDNDVKEQQEQ